MLAILTKIPGYKLSRAFGAPRMMPVNLTVSVTYRCNSRCKTCRIYERKCDELSLEEYRKIFGSIGTSPFWITFSGGEPFLRSDFADICIQASRACRPKIVNIPTNGMLPDHIEPEVRRIVHACPDTSFIINLSIDSIGAKHDEIRGVKNAYAQVVETYQRLRTIRSTNLTLGFHTVISKFNAKEIPAIYEQLKRLRPDSYITEIAEQRIELLTADQDIAPPYQDYAAAVDFISRDMRQWEMKKVSGITRAFRMRYYESVKTLLSGGKAAYPCYAGLASCQITPDGEVWACCIRSESMGNLRASGYDFRSVWFSDRARALRKEIKERNCSCPLANASYTNMICSLRTLAGIAAEVVVGR
jgi:MoaA/NifB/PqqE/SkfB family radical SAM enzyme